MEIIKFPGGMKTPSAIKTQESKMALGPMRFTCDCGSVAELSFSGIIFRHIDFYCTSCGSHYKVTNPAFVRPLPKKPPVI